MKELKSLIDQYLFVPISDELAEQLQVVVDNQVLGITAEVVTKYAIAIFRNQPDLTFKDNYKAKYRELYGEVLKIPNIVYLILEGYVLRQALQSKVIDAKQKARFSLIIRNCAVVRKGNWGGIVCSKWLMELYGYYEDYIKKQMIDNISCNGLIKVVTTKSQWAETGLEITDQTVYDQLRRLCAREVMVWSDQYVSSSEFKNINSPFVKAYLISKEMVKEWNWMYIAESPVAKLRESLGGNDQKRKQLGKIITEVVTGLTTEHIVKANEGSSLLLAQIFDGNSIVRDECIFSALEFGVYLYYEFLLETFNI